MGNDESPSEADLTKFEKFILNLYCKNSVPSCITTLADLRWQMFLKKQADSDRLPPTLAALKEKVSRAHYITLQWKSALINSPSLPDPNDYGWLFNKKDQVFEPVMTSLAPAQESIINLTVCNCKINYSANRCKCQKNGLNCSEMCGFENCENDEKDKETFRKSEAGDDDELC